MALKHAGQVCLFRFPQTDLKTGKRRPALLIARLPGPFDDWLVCMVSSQISQAIDGFDEILDREETDFVQSGLKTDSVIRIARLALVTEEYPAGRNRGDLCGTIEAYQGQDRRMD